MTISNTITQTGYVETLELGARGYAFSKLLGHCVANCAGEQAKEPFRGPVFWTRSSEILSGTYGKQYLDFLKGLNSGRLDLVGIVASGKLATGRIQRSLSLSGAEVFFEPSNIQEVRGDETNLVCTLSRLSKGRSIGLSSQNPSMTALNAIAMFGRSKSSNPYPFLTVGRVMDSRRKSTSELFISNAKRLVNLALFDDSGLEIHDHDLSIGADGDVGRVIGMSAKANPGVGVGFSVRALELPEYSEATGIAVAGYISKVALEHYNQTNQV